MKPYDLNHFTQSIIVTKNFAKAASTINSTEYNDLLQLRRDYPEYEVVQRKISKKSDKKNPNRNLTYKHMEEFIIALEGKDSSDLVEFEKVMKLSKVQAGPYAYVKTWFLNKYKDSFQNTEETPDDLHSKPQLALAQ